MPNILVVDDDEDLHVWLEQVLSKQNYTYAGVYSGENVVNDLKLGGVDLVLIDYALPRLDGLSLLRQLQDNNIKTPCIIMTANNAQNVAVQCFRNGAVDFIAKPLDPDYLNIIIERALASHAGHLRNMAYRALAYVKHKDDCSHRDNVERCSCGLREVIDGIQNF